MEDFLVNRLVTDAELLAMDGLDGRAPETWLFASRSLGIGPVTGNPVKPWLAWNELPATPFQEVRRTSNAQMRNFNLFVYDEEGDFTRINNILVVVRRIVKEMAPFTTPGGTRCSESDWIGISGNLPAAEYDGVVRFGIARFVVSQ